MTDPLPQIGIHIAPDMWRIGWNLIAHPQYIAVHGADGIMSTYTSGQIDERYLRRRIKRFEKEHGLCQPP